MWSEVPIFRSDGHEHMGKLFFRKEKKKEHHSLSQSAELGGVSRTPIFPIP